MPQALWIRFICLICCLVLMPVSATAALPAAGSPVYFLALADIHFDPFAACRHINKTPCPLIKQLRQQPVSAWGALLGVADTAPPVFRLDTNYVLLQHMLQEARKAAATYHPDFVLVMGDTLGHDFRNNYKHYAEDNSSAGYRNFAKKTLEYINKSFAEALPATSIYMVVGNNDTYSANYQSVPQGDFFHDAGLLWSSLIQNPAERTRMRAEFAAAGYYALDLPHAAGLRLIVLNSVLFSKKSSGELSAEAALTQLDWLHKQLQLAQERQQQVLIALHIPPRIDLYLMGRYRLFTAQQLFQPVYMARLQQELTAFYPQIIAVMSGHLHYGWVQALTVGYRHELPVISVPSVSPVFGNNPAFKVYQYQPAAARINGIYTYTDVIQPGQSWRDVRSLL